MTAGAGWSDGTRVTHAGLPAPVAGEPFLPGPVPAAAYHLEGGGPHRHGGYGRSGNPTWDAYERALGELEGGTAVVYASGMAALSAVLVGLLGAGDVLVLPADGYYTTRTLARDELTRLGIAVREVPTARALTAGDVEGASLVLLETPSNPGLDLADVGAAAEVAHAAGALLAVDNTTATPLGQQPLVLGADLSVCSDTKAMTGHGDLLLGHVAARDPVLAGRLRTWRTTTGSVPGPFETWLAHRSLATLDLRLGRQASNAQALCRVLAASPAVTGLCWPWWPGHPAGALARRQMRRPAGVLSFTLASEEAVAGFLAASALVTDATSFGGLHTTADRRARWGGDAVAAGFVRLSAGCEDTADLVADVTAALAGLPPA